MPIARVLIVLLAVVGIAFFLLDVRQSRDLDQATAIITGGHITHSQATHAASLLRSAGTLNPDSQVKLARAQLLANEGENQRAVSLAEQVTSDEPRNIIAWYELASVAGRSPKTLLYAYSKIKLLSPPVKHER